MKLRNKLYSAIICAALFVTGCNSTTSPPTTASAATVRAQGVMVANVDGGDWVSTATPVSGNQTAAVMDPATPRTITVTGVSTDGTAISIRIPDPHVGEESTIEATYTTDPLRFVGSGTADINIYDTVNRTISGTFSFTAYERLDSVPDNAPIVIRKLEVTNGIFSNFSWATPSAGAQ